jgi:hypothetical protein
VLVTLAGDADERGDIVYNVALSDRRAIATRDALVELGVSPDRILFATGWGKLYPTGTESEESCWSQSAHPYRAATRANPAHTSGVALAALSVRAGVLTSWVDTSQSA